MAGGIEPRGSGAAAGAPIDALTAGLAAPVPTYRFDFVYRRATDLADQLKQLGADLLSAFERRDAEELNLLQNRQEAAVLELTRTVMQNQVEIAKAGLLELQAAQAGANQRAQHYQTLIANGLSALQQAQLAMMATGAALHFTASGLKIGASVASGAPEIYVGPFIMGTSFGGEEIGSSLSEAAEVSSMFGEAFSMLGEALGVRADQERQSEDWNLALTEARTRAVGLVLARSAAQLEGDSFFLRFLSGIEATLTALDYALLLQIVPGEASTALPAW